MAVREAAFEPYFEQLRKLPFVRNVELVEGQRAAAELDGRLRLTTPTREFVLPADLKRTHLTRGVAAHLVQLAAEHEGLLVMAPAVGRDLGELFAEHGINFVDLAGNCFVQLGEQYVARVQGQRAEARPATQKALRAPSYRVIFALLADPELVHATARALAEAAGGVSPQTAVDVRTRLLEGGLLLKTRSGMRWAPGRRRELLDIFLAGFPVLMSGFVIGRFRAKQRAPQDVEAELAPRLAKLDEWRWGGDAAAHRLTALYRGERTIVYFRREPGAAAVRALPLVPDSMGDVTLVLAPGPLAFEGPSPDVVHPLLVYADLLSEGDERAREAAAEVYRQYVGEVRV